MVRKPPYYFPDKERSRKKQKLLGDIQSKISRIEKNMIQDPTYPRSRRLSTLQTLKQRKNQNSKIRRASVEDLLKNQRNWVLELLHLQSRVLRRVSLCCGIDHAAYLSTLSPGYIRPHARPCSVIHPGCMTQHRLVPLCQGKVLIRSCVMRNWAPLCPFLFLTPTY